MWSNLGRELIQQCGVPQPAPPRREGPSPVRAPRPGAESRGQAGIHYRANWTLFRHTGTWWARWARLVFLSTLGGLQSRTEIGRAAFRWKFIHLQPGQSSPVASFDGEAGGS